MAEKTNLNLIDDVSSADSCIGFKTKIRKNKKVDQIFLTTKNNNRLDEIFNSEENVLPTFF